MMACLLLIWTNDGVFFIGPSEHVSEIWILIQKLHSRTCFKMSSAKCRPFVSFNAFSEPPHHNATYCEGVTGVKGADASNLQLPLSIMLWMANDELAWIEIWPVDYQLSGLLNTLLKDILEDKVIINSSDMFDITWWNATQLTWVMQGKVMCEKNGTQLSYKIIN